VGGHSGQTLSVRPEAVTDLIARAGVRKAAGTVGIVDIDVEDLEGRLIAIGRGCYGTKPS
jgi:acyl-coenzyme A thioesterase PaaI-like protein